MRRALVPLLVLGLTACSGGGGEQEAPTLEERRDAYVAEAEDVCAEANEAVDGVQLPTSVSEVPTTADEVLGIARSTVEEVAALAPPEEDRAELEEKVLGPLRGDLTGLEEYVDQLKAAAASNDGATLLRLSQERPQTTADLGFMRDYGFVECVTAAGQTG